MSPKYKGHPLQDPLGAVGLAPSGSWEGFGKGPRDSLHINASRNTIPQAANDTSLPFPKLTMSNYNQLDRSSEPRRTTPEPTYPFNEEEYEYDPFSLFKDTGEQYKSMMDGRSSISHHGDEHYPALSPTYFNSSHYTSPNLNQ